MKRLRVVKDSKSPTGYYITRGDSNVPATDYEVRLWQMYIEALDLAVRIRNYLEKESLGHDSVAEGKGSPSQKSK
jgi:hypothetical protein